MLHKITEYLKEKNIRITRESLYKHKSKIIDYIATDDEFGEEYLERVARDIKSDFYLYSFNTYLPLDDDICGACAVRQIRKTKKLRVYVLSFFAIIDIIRGNGYGYVMFETLIEKLCENTDKKVVLYTHSLDKSVGFYEKMGFKKTDVVCDYMHHLEDIDDDDIMMMYECNKN